MRAPVVLFAGVAAAFLAACAREAPRAIATAPHPQVAPRQPQRHAAGSMQMQFLAALERADSVEVVSLASREAEISRRSRSENDVGDEEEWNDRTEAAIDTQWCTSSDACIDGNHVLGRVAVTDAVNRRALVAYLRGWLETEPGWDVACIPEFRHAIEFDSDGVRWQALLCYQCGQYSLLQDGKVIMKWGQAGRASGHDWFSDRFAAAGVPVESPSH